MNFKAFIDDNDAVSPVIGVILMVAITVILAAVIGTFVLGLGDQVQTTAPNANWDAEGNSTSIANGNNESIVDFSHQSGQSIDAAALDISHDVDTSGGISATTVTYDDELSAGSEVYLMVENGVSTATTIDSHEVDLVWQSEGQSSTLSTHEVEEITLPAP